MNKVSRKAKKKFSSTTLIVTFFFGMFVAWAITPSGEVLSGTDVRVAQDHCGGPWGLEKVFTASDRIEKVECDGGVLHKVKYTERQFRIMVVKGEIIRPMRATRTEEWPIHPERYRPQVKRWNPPPTPMAPPGPVDGGSPAISSGM